MDILGIFGDFKSLITSVTHFQRDALHIHIGIVLFLFMAMVFRGERRFRYAWLILVGITLLGEAFDILDHLVAGVLPRFADLADSVKDIFNTLFWPALLYRFGPQLARMLGLSFTDSRIEPGQPTPVAAPTVPPQG